MSTISIDKRKNERTKITRILLKKKKGGKKRKGADKRKRGRGDKDKEKRRKDGVSNSCKRHMCAFVPEQGAFERDKATGQETTVES